MPLFSLFKSVSAVGGLEINDLALKFFVFEAGKTKFAATQLPPGVITDGKIFDYQKFSEALEYLHRQVAAFKKILPTVLVLPASIVRSEAFSFPHVEPKKLTEVANLNLQVMSPRDLLAIRSGYEIFGIGKENRYEAIGAFADAQLIDDYINVLKAANFVAIAVEYPVLAFTRFINKYGAGLKSDIAYLFIAFSLDGPNFLVIKNNHVYSSYFKSWNDIQKDLGGRKLTTEDTEEFLRVHVKDTLNSYSSKWGTTVSEAILISSPINDQISKVIQENFNLHSHILPFKEFGELSSEWQVAIGAALRSEGLDLLPTKYKKNFDYLATLNFIKSWRNAVAIFFGFFAIASLAANFLMSREASKTEEALLSPGLVSKAEVEDLQGHIMKFNSTVDLALRGQEMSPDWSPFWSKLRSLAGDRVSFQRVSVDSNQNVLLIGKAINDKAVLAFKDDVANQPNFEDVILPLSNIKVNEDGTVTFTLQFVQKFFKKG